MATEPERKMQWMDSYKNLPMKFELFSGSGSNGQTMTLKGYPCTPWVHVEIYDTTNNVWSTQLVQETALTGKARGFTYTYATRTLTFGDGTDGYKPASGTYNVAVVYHALDPGSNTTSPAYARIQDGDGTTLADVEAAMTFVYDTGVVTGTQGNTIVEDTEKTWTVDALIGMTVVVHTEGGAAPQAQTITDNDANTITVGSAWATNPTDGVTHYEIRTARNALLVKLVGGGIDIDEMNLDVSPKVAHYKSTPQDLSNLQDAQLLVDIKGNAQVVGPTAHNATVARAPVLTGAYAKDGVPTDVDDGDVVNMWATQSGAVVQAGYDTDNTISRPIYLDDEGCQRMVGAAPHNATADGDPVQVGGVASTSIPTAVTTGDVAQVWTTINGAPVVAGYDTDATTSRNIEVDGSGRQEVVGAVDHDTTVAGAPVRVGAYASDAVPTDVADGDTVNIWASQQGAPVAAGYDTDNTISRPIYVDDEGCQRMVGAAAHNATADGDPVLTGGVASTSIPTAVTTGDAAQVWTTINGAQVMGGYDTDATTSRNVEVDGSGRLEVVGAIGHDSTSTGAPVRTGSYAKDGAPTDVADGDVVNNWATQQGAQVVAGYDTDNTMSRPLEVDGSGRAEIVGPIAHDGTAAGAPILGGAYASDAAPSDVADGDVARNWCAQNGAQVMAGYDTDNTIARPLYLDDEGCQRMVGAAPHNATADGDPVQVGGVASTSIPAAVTTGDVAQVWTSINGGQVVAGYDTDATTSRNIEVDGSGRLEMVGAIDHDSTATGAPVRTGAYASDEAPTDVDDGDAVNLWATQNGAQVVGGYDTDNTISRPIYLDDEGCQRMVGAAPHNATADGDPVQVGGVASTSIPTAVTTGDVAQIWTSINGGVVIGGYDTDATTSRNVEVDGSGRLEMVGAVAHNATSAGAPVRTGGYASDAVPSDVADGDAVNDWSTQQGAKVIAGYDTDNTISRPLEVDGTGRAEIVGAVAHDATSTGAPVMMGAYASDAVPTDVDDADAVNLWASQQGAIVIAGYDTSNTVARPFHVDSQGDLVVSFENVTTTTTLTWTGAGGAVTDAAPDTDTAIDCTGAKQIAVQLRTPSNAAGVATSDCYAIGSPDNSTYDDTAYVLPFDDIAESKEVSRTITPGPLYLKLRLTVTENVAADETHTAVVTVVK